MLGLIDGAPIILAAIGFTLIYYFNGFINVAYAENLTVGAYIAIVLNQTLGLNFFVAILPAAVLTGLFSVLTYLLVFRPALNRGVGPTEMIVLSVGLSFFIRHTVRIPFGAELYLFEFANPSFLRVLGTGVTSSQLTSLALVAAISVALYLFIHKTRLGQMMRGLANNRDLALVSGINPSRVSITVWFFAGVAGGLAGIFIGVFSFIDYLLGWNQILIIIMVAILGRVGNLPGAVVAGFAASVFTALVTFYTQPTYAQVALLVIFIAVLKLRSMSLTGLLKPSTSAGTA